MKGRLRTPDGEEHPIGDGLPPVECFRCGVCCVRYQPPVVPEEVESVASGLGIAGKDFLSRYAQLTNVGYLLRQSEGRCVFLKLEKGEDRAVCGIYSFRPRACRNWVASLSRRECREGLAAKGKVLLADELYPGQKDVGRFSEDLYPG